MYYTTHEHDWTAFAIHQGYSPTVLVVDSTNLFITFDTITHQWIVSRVKWLSDGFVPDQSYETSFFPTQSEASHHFINLCNI